MKITLKNFIVPHQPRAEHKVTEPSVAAVVPTYKPGATALRLVEDLLAYNPRLRVVVVDDSTPLEHPGMDTLRHLRELSARVTVLRTPQNKLKAGALNLGVRYLLEQKGPGAAAAILTLDDDVAIGPQTIERMTHELLADPELGAVCSRCSVSNKAKNILTRLQGLEYVGFNAIRLGDQGFTGGPLVMHGMLAAYRARALRQVGLFAERHLIEDYEMTARLKERGWRVKAVLGARASTEVPETLGALWRQRTRWSYGGVQVVLGVKDRTAVLQDVLGHGVFIGTLATIVLLLVVRGTGAVPHVLVQAIIALSLIQALVWYGLQLWLMRWYGERDAIDWLLRASLVPELLYSSLMTLALLGSYAFLGFSILSKPFINRKGAVARILSAGRAGFRWLGYSGEWGTRGS